MRRIIKWHSQHLEIDAITGKLVEYQDRVDEEEEYWEDSEGYVSQKLDTQNVMSTPFGIWRVDDSMNPYAQFKMWMAHTNFSITEDIVNKLRIIPGVEVLQIMTRYRFIIGVAELFNISDVRKAIEDQLMCYADESVMINNDDLLQQVHKLKEQLSTYNRWAIYVFPNGEIDFTTSEEENFGSQLNTFKQAVDYSNGVLIESDND